MRKEYAIIWLVFALLLSLEMVANKNLALSKHIPLPTDTIPKKDSTPRHPTPIFKAINKYLDVIGKKATRDSLMKKLSEEKKQGPDAKQLLNQRTESFTKYKGRVIRNIYYNRLKVFGTPDIEDTMVTARTRLINLANSIHTHSREWVIRQSLFLKQYDTVNAYILAENERYLRNRPFMNDARIYVINALRSADSVDLLVVTKDLFEYGGSMDNLTPTSFEGSVYNLNLLGAGQSLELGLRWEKDYTPELFTSFRYIKYNIAGTFTDASIGFSDRNNYLPIDSGVYERTYFLSMSRPLYSSGAKFTGGLYVALNHSLNVLQQHDTVFRDYSYHVSDIWGGYNFRNQFRKDGSVSNKPNIAVTLRHYKLSFDRSPQQEVFKQDPVYNSRRFILGSLVFFKQSFFKTNYFFGYGRTEDIPLGFSASASVGTEKWISRNRTYLGVDLQKFWLTKNNALLNTNFDWGGYWNKGHAEDNVLHIDIEYYSRLFNIKNKRLRYMISSDYLVCPNPYILKPLNINRDAGIRGYGDTKINGYQRWNIRAEGIYYSRINVLGFKFNFFGLMQSSLLAEHKEPLFKSPFYSSVGLGCNIRNEHLPLSTLQLSASYMPGPPKGINPLFLEIRTIVDFRFNIYALRAPTMAAFQ